MDDPQTRANEESVAGGGRFFFLFLFLLAQIILYPYAEGRGIVFQVFRTLAIFVTLASVYAVSFRRSTWIIAVLFAIPVVWHRALVPDLAVTEPALVGLMTSFLFDIFIIIVIFHRVFSAKSVTSATIFGALSIYLLAGFAFTRLYLFVSAVQPHAFYLDPVLNHHVLPDQTDLIYYSFGMMTSLGSAGISPVSPQARSLSVIEAILGIFYLGVLVSRLIATYVPQMVQRNSRDRSTERHS